MPKHFVPFSFLLLLLFCAYGAAAQDLLPAPAVESGAMIEAPQPASAHQPAGFWTFRRADAPALRTNREAFHDKTWKVMQSVWLASVVYDAETTKAGLSHHRCVERNVDGPYPRRSQIYVSQIPAGVVYTDGKMLPPPPQPILGLN